MSLAFLLVIVGWALHISLEDHRRRLGARGTDAHEPVPHLTTLHLVGQRRDDAGTRGGKRMANRDGASELVQLVLIDRSDRRPDEC